MNESIEYNIIIRGRVETSLCEWFGDVDVVYRSNDEGRTITELRTGSTDQAALRGMLSRIWNLGLSILSVEPVEEIER